MDKRYVAIYTTVLFLPHRPLEELIEEGLLVNKDVSSIEEAEEIFEELDELNCWNMQIYDKKMKEYV